MYAADLTAISLDDFERTLLSVELIPSRRVLRDRISDVCGRLRDRGIDDLEGSRLLLRDKAGYPELAIELGVDVEYLTLLSREINSYRTKPLALARLEGLPPETLDALESVGIHTTEDLYERAAGKRHRLKLAEALDLPEERLMYALELSDLVRITGVGPASAHVLYEIGLHGPRDYLATDSATIQQRYADHTETRLGRREVLGVSDIDYCRRYCTALSDDIER